MKDKKQNLINISTKTFIGVLLLLAVLIAVSVLLTYIVPKGAFGTLPDGSTDYSRYERLEGEKGIPVIEGLLAPILVFGSSDGLTLIILSFFLMVISAAFQVMNDVGGIRTLVGSLSERFKNRRKLLIIAMSFLFYCFGSFLGLFEEMLTMLPIAASLCVLLGYDSFCGFLVCIISCGFGFASAITNPFTVLLASGIIGVNPMTHIYYRLIIFAVMFALLSAYILMYMARLEKDPSMSLTLAHDENLRLSSGYGSEDRLQKDGRIKKTYTVFLLMALTIIIVSSMTEAIRNYSVVILIAYFLLGGIIAGTVASGNFKTVIKSFLSGLLSVLPTIVFIAMAASVKYVLEKGGILATLVNTINGLASGKSSVQIAFLIYLIVLLLEFFISSSTAKAILVMGLLSVVNVGLSKSMMVLIYTFADGYTNVLFPTSPVLLIALSMIELDYFKWVKKSLPLFTVNLMLVLGFIALGVLISY